MNKPTALIFFGIIVIGAVISYFTLVKQPEKPVVAPVVEAPPVEPAKPMVTEPVAVVKPPVPAVTPEVPAQKKEPGLVAPGIFDSAEAAMTALAAKIGEKNFDGFLSITGPEAVSEAIRSEVKALIESPGLKLDTAKPFTEVSKSAEAVRWSLNFVPLVDTAAPRQLYADLATTGEKSLDITKVSFPMDLTALPARGGTASAEPVAKAATPMTPEQQSDALTVAHAFSKAVIRRDFNTARGLADPATVTDERVAALMIAVEEGKFVMKEDRPLVVTLSRDDITWVLTRVQSDQTASEFALELGQVDNAWKVNGLTFSKVLSALSEKAGAGDVAYSPIVEDPSGGDSLVLYFEFDDAGLTPRTSRQLEIVADILSQGAERVIRINGHADALGSDDYNISLSDKRAESIRQTLISMGVKPDQVITEAFGAKKPRKPNFLPDGSDNPGGRSQNRRAEVLLDF
jgi:outer membrane protein OmpA-like peptidoglycan-associated protein